MDNVTDTDNHTIPSFYGHYTVNLC